MAALSITTDGSQTITDATGAAGVVYLSGGTDGASVHLVVTMANGLDVPLSGSNLKLGANVVYHGTGAALKAVCVGSGGSSTLSLEYKSL